MKGVGILLDKAATLAWKNAGEKWEAISSRVVMATLKAVRSARGQRQPGGSRETSDISLSVLSAYTPTAKAPPTVKAKFIDKLQDALDRMCWELHRNGVYHYDHQVIPFPLRCRLYTNKNCPQYCNVYIPTKMNNLITLVSL